KLATLWRAQTAARRHRLQALAALLGERNPLRLLERGYALVYDAQGTLASTPAQFAPGDPLRIRFAAGWLEAEAKPPR
ncbi:MAG: exodeoxyribonuclease VII large subunit, partial [Terriglobales bacterium]